MTDENVAAASELEAGAHVSRRGLVKNAAGVGAAGLAVGMLLTSAGGTAHAAAQEERPNHSGHGAREDVEGAFIVHVRDLKTGDLEIFHGHRRHSLRDRKLAAALRHALG